MARILFGSIPLWGHISPTIAIAQKLMEMGHTVSYACHPEVNDKILASDIAVIDTFRWQDLLVSLNKIRHLDNMRFFWRLFIKRILEKIEYLFLDNLEQGVNNFLKVIDEWMPDVCVFDIFFHPGFIAAEIRQML